MNRIFKSNILIVDDEAPILKLLEKFLSIDEHTCVGVQSVPEALKAMESQRFDVIITDWKVGKESGMDLLRHASDHFPETGRMMMTGHNSMEAAQEALAIGVYGYLHKPLGKEMVRISVQNALHHMNLENHMQACLKEAQEEVFEKNRKLEAILNNIDIGVIMVDEEMNILTYNKTMEKMFPKISDQATHRCFEIIPEEAPATSPVDCPMVKAFETKKTVYHDRIIHTSEGVREFKISTIPITGSSGEPDGGIIIFHDVTDIMENQKDISDTNKLVAVGQLAAGIAHEINTPTQFLGDNIRFLKESFEELQPLFNINNDISGIADNDPALLKKLITKLKEEVENVDLEYLAEELPIATSQSLEGVQRVSQIVKAMKDFSHPDESEKSLNNINELLRTTLIICKNEWKYVAQIQYELDENLPHIECVPSELSQVFLILIVNAAHAIEEKMAAGENTLGHISVGTRKCENEEVEITIQDTGAGIPADIQEKIFEVFFTTKKRGKGTGQGLSLARKLIDNHNGNLTFSSEVNKGTKFHIRLPICS